MQIWLRERNIFNTKLSRASCTKQSGATLITPPFSYTTPFLLRVHDLCETDLSIMVTHRSCTLCIIERLMKIVDTGEGSWNFHAQRTGSEDPAKPRSCRSELRHRYSAFCPIDKIVTNVSGE